MTANGSALTDGELTWQDMPGQSPFIKRCNFSLFRRGLLSRDELQNMRPGPLRDKLMDEAKARNNRRIRLYALKQWDGLRYVGLAGKKELQKIDERHAKRMSVLEGRA